MTTDLEAKVRWQLTALAANAGAIQSAAITAQGAVARCDRRDFERAMLSLSAAGLRLATALEAIPPLGTLADLFEPPTPPVVNMDRPNDDPARDPKRDVRIAGPYSAVVTLHGPACDCGACSAHRIDKTA